MTPEKSKIVGRQHSLASAIFIFLTVEIIFLIWETRGDFANGFLFFIDHQMNLFTILSFVIFFLLFIKLGQLAGYKILILKANPFKIAFLYGLITTTLMLAYYAIPLIRTLYDKTGMYNETDQNQRTQSFLLFSVLIFLFFIVGWIITTHRISKADDK